MGKSWRVSLNMEDRIVTVWFRLDNEVRSIKIPSESLCFLWSLILLRANSRVRSEVATDWEGEVTIGTKLSRSPPMWSHSVPFCTLRESIHFEHFKPVSRLALSFTPIHGTSRKVRP